MNSAIKDKASEVISSLEIRTPNYRVALVLLQKMVRKWAIFEMDSLTKESSTGLRKLIDQLNRHVAALESLGDLVNSWVLPVIYTLRSKLGTLSKKLWEGHHVDLRCLH